MVPTFKKCDSNKFMEKKKQLKDTIEYYYNQKTVLNVCIYIRVYCNERIAYKIRLKRDNVKCLPVSCFEISCSSLRFGDIKENPFHISE